jgi:hypothetical protein
MNLLESAEHGLTIWMELATLRDTFGVPVDLMYVYLDGKGFLPQVFHNGELRFVTSEEFAKCIKECIVILQGGGLERFVEMLIAQNGDGNA